MKQRQRIAIQGFVVFAGALILGVKWIAYFLTGSTALKSDAYEGIVNVMAGLFGLGALIFAGRPADADHPYGHGKIEHFSAAFEGGLVSLASAIIAYEGVASLVRGNAPHELGTGILLNACAGLMNGGLGLFLLYAGKKSRSAAMRADGMHLLSDFWTTLGMLLGLGAVALTGAQWLDSTIALAIAALLAWTGFRLVRESSMALLDAEDPRVIARLVDSINRHRTRQLVAIHELRTFRSGRYTHVDIHVVMPEFLPLRQTHDEADRFAAANLASAEIEGEFHSHVDPCKSAFCGSCYFEPCPIRKCPPAIAIPDNGAPKPWTVAEVTAKGSYENT